MPLSLFRDIQAGMQAGPHSQGTSHSLLRTPLFGSAVPRRQRTGIKTLMCIVHIHTSSYTTGLSVCCASPDLREEHHAQITDCIVCLQLASRGPAHPGKMLQDNCDSHKLRYEYSLSVLAKRSLLAADTL